MTVRLIAISKPVISELATPGDLLAYCARVSNPSNQANTETADRLLKYLVRNAHWSPFEMAHMTVEIETTRDIARQILRHRSFAFQEFSGRYAEMPEKPVLREARMQDLVNRQNSLPCNDELLADEWQTRQDDVIREAQRAYRWALKHGIAKEQARSVLPEGNTVSRLYMAGSVRSFLHYLQVRLDPATQKEHRDVAVAIKHIVLHEFPALRDVIGEGD